MVFTLFARAAWAQSGSGLSGMVKDSSGAMVGNAIVTLVDDKTSGRKSTVSTPAGAYTFIDLAPGTYALEASAEGFAVFTSRVTAGAAPSMYDIGLQLAAQAGQVSVEARIDPFNVLPATLTQSLFGLDKSLEDTPRSISTADAETLVRYSVKTVNDLVTVAPGTFSAFFPSGIGRL